MTTTHATTTQLYKPLPCTQGRLWGEVRYQSGTLPTQYTYTGQYSEGYINLLFYGSRRYAPALGRFAQADTLVPGAGNPMAWDRYAYGYNSPMVYRDPSGHCNMYMYENGQCPDGELPTVVTETPDDQQDLSSPPSITENDKSPVNDFFESADYISFSYYKSPTKRLGQLLELISLISPIPEDVFGVPIGKAMEAFSVGVTITSADDGLYISPGVSLGKTALGSSDTNISVVLGWTSNGDPESILKGFSTSHGSGAIFGGNYVNVPGNDYAIEFGLMGPAVTLNFITASYGVKIPFPK